MNRLKKLINLSFPNSNILLCFFFFRFIYDLYFLILAIIAQMFIPTAELVISTEKQTNEANAEIEMQPVTAEARISKCLT